MLKYSFSLFFSIIVFVSCNQENLAPSTSPNTDLNADWISFFASKTKDWTTTYSTEKRNVCGWADNPGNTIDCSGGDCFITTSVPGHDACIGCTVSDELACFGPNGGVLMNILSEMAVSFPRTEIEYEVFDVDSNSLGLVEGRLGQQISRINSISATDRAAYYTVRISTS